MSTKVKRYGRKRTDSMGVVHKLEFATKAQRDSAVIGHDDTKYSVLRTLWGQGRDAGIKAERARIVARLRELASALRAEAETHGDTVFGTVAAVQEKTIEGLVSIIEKSEEP